VYGHEFHLSHPVQPLATDRQVLESARLCRYCVSDCWLIHSKRLLRLLLRPSQTETVLDDGKSALTNGDPAHPNEQICTLGVGCTAASVMPRFRTPAWRPVRAGMFVAMGLSAVFPTLDGLATYGWEQMQRQIGLFWLVLQGALYILGAGLYAVSQTRCPK
jgi:hypothetical protein